MNKNYIITKALVNNEWRITATHVVLKDVTATVTAKSNSVADYNEAAKEATKECGIKMQENISKLVISDCQIGASNAFTCIEPISEEDKFYKSISKTINVLGQEYEIRFLEEDKDDFSDKDGYCNFWLKRISICKMRGEWSLEEYKILAHKVLKHEIIHAFLHESGLAYSTTDSWAVNEEMVDFFALQIEKIYKAILSIEEK